MKPRDYHKEWLNRFVFGQLTDEMLSQMTSAIKAVLEVWASNNRLDRLIGKHELEYPYN